MAYQVVFTEDSNYEVHKDNGEVLRVGDNVYQDDLPQLPPQKIKKFFYPENSETLYVQFDEGRGCNDGCMGVSALTKMKP